MTGPVASWRLGSNPRQYVLDGYQRNWVVYRAIREIADAAKSIKIELYRGETLIEKHPVLDLLGRPNPRQSYSEWLGEMLVNRLLFGETVAVSPNDGKPAELWAMYPPDIQVLPGKGGLAAGYRFQRGNARQEFPANPMTGESNVFFAKTYNPEDYWRGQSPLMAGKLAVDTLNAGGVWNYSLLKNGARPFGLVKFKNGYPGQEMIQRMREYFKAAIQGERNAGEIPMLAEDAEWVSISHSPQDMDFLNTTKESAKYIASVYGVPLPLIDNDASTFNNMEQAKERLYTDTVIPLLQEFMGALGRWLLPRYGRDDLHFALDLDSIPALEGLRQKMFDRAVTAYEKGVLTREESRVMMGFPEQGNGEYRQIGTAPQLPTDDAKALAYGLEVKDDSYKPNQEMIDEAKRGLDWRSEHGRGGTEVGVARARDISNGKNLSRDTVRRMHSYFARHEVDKQGEGWSPGEDGYPSAGRIAWALWGGDAGKAWAGKIIRQMDSE